MDAIQQVEQGPCRTSLAGPLPLAVSVWLVFTWTDINTVITLAVKLEEQHGELKDTPSLFHSLCLSSAEKQIKAGSSLLVSCLNSEVWN